MYTQKEIDNDRKHYLQEQKVICKQLLKDTEGTCLVWEVSCDYDADKWDKNIIEICRTEAEAQNCLKGMKEEGITDLFYRPVVIDDDSGEKVTFQNLHYYKKDSYFVKSLNELMYN